MHHTDKTGYLKIICFEMNHEPFAIPVQNIREVNRMVHLQKIKKAQPYVLGLINYHGCLTPVLDLRMLINSEPSILTQKSLWIAVNYGQDSVCLVVESIRGFMNIDLKNLCSMPTLVQAKHIDFLLYFAKMNQEFIPIIDVTKLLSVKEKQILVSMVTE
ncbi:MAG: chemotaxis protein CheW [Desulfobacterales bacterium]|nr:chemotaxis protein CheW [Desulfobacterales bacterium]